jgi:hypothetical protein
MAPAVLALAWSVWRWLRDGRWPRPDPYSAVAATIVRELRSRHDWNQVHARLVAPAEAS